MPKLTLHPLSVAIGLAVAGLVALTTSQASPPPASLNPASIRVEYMPHPRDMVQIRQGTPFTVPPGKLFVLSALGAPNSGTSSVTLLIDGVAECFAPTVFNGQSPNPWPIASGLSIPAGSVIDLAAAPNTNARAWGYLASQ